MAERRILVVEDESVIASEIRGSLGQLGYTVVDIVASGDEAVEKTGEHAPDLVLMDIVLKGKMDGIQAAEEIRSRHKIPVLYLTAYTDENTMQQAKISEPYGYIVKPFEDRELHSNIEMALYKHEAEEEKNRLYRELEQKNKELQQKAHELRTPLTPLFASAKLLAEQFSEEIGSREKRLIRNILNGSESLEARLSELLDLARFQPGAFDLQIAPVDTTSFLKEICAQFQPLAHNMGQSLVLDVPQTLPTVQADSRRLEQVLTNLLGNAVKFTPDGGMIALRATVRNEDLVIKVQDSGHGLSPDEQERVFQPYYRSEVDRQTLPGAGLGLSLCKELIEAHEGTMWVESEVGEGSTFSFSVPLKGPSRCPTARKTHHEDPGD